MNTLPKSSWLLSVEDYLAFEEQSDVRHEYIGGEIHAIAGASERHQLIVFNVASALRETARACGCRIILNDVKLQTDDAIYYPDVMVLCDPNDDDPYIKERPTLIVEVLSPTTVVTDRREKMVAYRRLPSLLCHLVIHQSERRIERHWREIVDEPWELEMVVDGTVKIPALQVQLALGEVYEGVETSNPE